MKSVATGTVLALLLLTGCQTVNRHHNPYDPNETAPRVIGASSSPVSDYAKKILSNASQPHTDTAKIRKMELETQKEIEKLKAQKELEIARMKAEAERAKIMTEKELGLKQLQAKLEEIVGDRKMVGWVLFLSALFLFVLLWVVFKLVREYYAHKKRVEEERMRHEKELQEKELQARLAEKMFDALASGNLSETQQNRLLDSLAGANQQLIHKKES